MELYRGTIFRLTYCFDKIENQAFIITEYNDDPEFVFQIVCISGFKAGTILGHIKRSNRDKLSITRTNLISEIKRNFLNPDMKSLEIYKSIEEMYPT